MRRLLLLLALATAAAPAMAQRYEAVLHEGAQAVPVGVVMLDAKHRLSMVSARPGRAEWLRSLIDSTNEETTLHLDAPPPAGAPRLANTTRPVPRDDPRFDQALRLHLRRIYDVSLR